MRTQIDPHEGRKRKVQNESRLCIIFIYFYALFYIWKDMLFYMVIETVDLVDGDSCDIFFSRLSTSLVLKVLPERCTKAFM